MQAQSHPDDSIPRARPAPSRPVANKSVSFSLLIVVGALIIYGVSREWSYLTRTLIPQITQSVTVSFGPRVTPTPAVYEQSNRETLEDVFLSYDDQGVIVTDRSTLRSQRLVKAIAPTRIVRAMPGGQEVVLTQQVADEQSVSVYTLSTQSATELFRFLPSANGVSFEKQVSVSPSGRYIAYSHGAGDLSLYDRTAGENRLLVLGRPCDDGAGDDCSGYFEPQWSPDGEQLLVNKRINDSSTLVVLRPFSQPMESDDLRLAGRDGVWLPSNTAVVAAGEYENLYYLGHFSDVTATSLLAKYFSTDPIRVGTLALSAHTQVAFAYTQSPAVDEAPALGLYDIKTQRFEVLDTGRKGQRWEVLEWIDETQEVVVRVRDDDRVSYAVYATQRDARHELLIPGEYGMVVGQAQ